MIFWEEMWNLPKNKPKEITKEILEEELWDHYSELPNPLWYEQPIQIDNVDDKIKPAPQKTE